MPALARLTCLLLLAVVGASWPTSATAQAASTVAYNAKESWLPSDSNKASRGAGCQTRVIDIAAGQYLYRAFDRNLRHTANGAYERTFAKDRLVYLAAGRYVWTDCMYLSVPGQTTPCYPNCSNQWEHDSALTRTSTGGVVRNDVAFRARGGYDRITEFGSALFRCSVSPAC